jgi:hypothetical protein
MVMPVTPIYGNGGNGGFGGFGSDGWWIILLLLCGWGNGGFGGMGGFAGGLGIDFPWLLNGQNGINNNVNDGFRDAQLHDSVTSVRDGVSNLATQLCGCCGDMQMSIANSTAGIQQSLCNGFAGTTAAITGAQNALSQQLNTNEIANLNRSFAEQTANMQGFNGINSGVADLRYTVATEACADRAAVGDALQAVTMQGVNNTNALLGAITGGIQSIKDQLCQDKIDAKNDEIAQLRQEVLYARGQASQDVQTARILAGQASEIDGVYNRLKNCPVPSMPVYGMQPVFTCQPQQSCGCGCGNGFAN